MKSDSIILQSVHHEDVSMALKLLIHQRFNHICEQIQRTTFQQGFKKTMKIFNAKALEVHCTGRLAVSIS